MLKASIVAQRQGAVIEAVDPVAKDNWAVVKILSAPMCTEYKAYAAGQVNAFLGHEAMGEVVDVAQPGRVVLGDRVVVMPSYACGRCDLCIGGEYIHCQDSLNFNDFASNGEGRATMAQLMLKPDWLLPKVPDDVSDDHAALACCGLGPTFGAMQRMGVSGYDTLLVTGLGPVGLGGVVNGVYRGARVIAVDAHPWRRQRALELGAEVALQPDEYCLQALRDLSAGRGVDNAIDCSGNPQAHRLCIDAVRRRGDVAFVGECSDETPIRISSDMIRKGIRLIGSWHYNMADFSRLMATVRAVPQQLDRLISHRFPLEKISTAWDLQLTGECAKIILKPWENPRV